MSENLRGNAKDKGFWDGGASGHGSNGEASGRPSGFPGRRAPKTIGIRTDIDFPNERGVLKEPKS
jgi:hypothetical protein